MPPRNPDRCDFLITGSIILMTGFNILNIVILLPDKLTVKPKAGAV